jgi:hypothetical protein
MPRDQVGVIKVGTVRKWLAHKRRWDARFGAVKARVRAQRLRDVREGGGYEVYGGAGEVPPPSALVGRWRKVMAEGKAEGGGKKKGEEKKRKKARGLGLSLWALWGSKHDEDAVQREQHAARSPEMAAASPSQGHGARAFSDLEKQERAAREKGGAAVPSAGKTSRPEAWRGLAGVKEQVGEEAAAADGGSVGAPAEGDADLRPAGPVSTEKNETGEQAADGKAATGFLSLDDAAETGVTGKRVMIGGLATPFSLRKEPETASMITLATPVDQRSVRTGTADSSSVVAAPSGETAEQQGTGEAEEQGKGSKDLDGVTPETATPFMTPVLTPGTLGERPGLERFATAQEDVATASP